MPVPVLEQSSDDLISPPPAEVTLRQVLAALLISCAIGLLTVLVSPLFADLQNARAGNGKVATSRGETASEGGDIQRVWSWSANQRFFVTDVSMSPFSLRRIDQSAHAVTMGKQPSPPWWSTATTPPDADRVQNRSNIAESASGLPIRAYLQRHDFATGLDVSRWLWQGVVANTMIIGVAIFGALRWRSVYRLGVRMHRMRRGLCLYCGYPLENISDDRCPECGRIHQRPSGAARDAVTGT